MERVQRFLKKVHLWHIVVLAAVLRLGWYLFILYTHPEGLWLYDSDGYWNIAYNLHEYGIFSRDAVPPITPDYFRTPLYPLLIYPTVAADPSGNTVPLLQIIPDTAVCFMLYKITGYVTGRHVYAKLAALIYALHLPAVFMSGFVLAESLFLCLLTWFLWMLLRCSRTFSPAGVLLAGLVGGLCVMCKPLAFALVFPGLLFLLLYHRIKRKTLVLSFLFLAGFYTIQLPWMYRNKQVYGHYFNSLLGEHLVFGYQACHVYAKANNLDYFEVKDMLLEKYYRTIDFNPYRHPYEYARLIREEAFHILWKYRGTFLGEHLKECLKFFVKPLRAYISHQVGNKPYTRHITLTAVVLQVMELLFLYGCILTYIIATALKKRQPDRFVFFILGVLVFFCQFNTMPYTDARIRFPFDGWIIAAAVVSLCLVRRGKRLDDAET